MVFKIVLIGCLLAFAHSRHLNVKFPTLGTRIVGGQDALPGQFPHQVSLRAEFEPLLPPTHFCGGTILNDRWILTAKHCLDGFEELPPFLTMTVKAGEHDLSTDESSEQVSAVEKYIKHESHGRKVNFLRDEVSPYDVGLIKLKTPLKSNERVAKAVLPKKDSEPTGLVILSGWGSIVADPEKPVVPNILQTATLPIVDRETCNKAVRKLAIEEGQPLDEDIVYETNICTGPLTGGTSACVGDSGGSLVSTNDKNEFEIIGVPSWVVAPCGRKGAPTVYARVSSFVDWIEDTINNN